MENMIQLHQGDCLETLRTMPDNSVDSIVTDPPYGLAFMGKRWDYDVPSVEIWAECLRVLKPGGHLLAFAGTRTQHRMAVRIEDAGFEIRDMIAWTYGSGFPKSRDVSGSMTAYLAGDRAIGGAISPDVYRVTAFLREARERAGWTNRQVDNLFGTNGMAGHWTTSGSQPAVPSARQWEILKQHLGFGGELDNLVAELGANERPEDWGNGEGKDGPFLASVGDSLGATQSWGTALKPALEPITVARKPPAGTVTNNVRAYGTGALNIDGCRVAAEKATGWKGDGSKLYEGGLSREGGEARPQDAGRWPANLIHDGSEPADLLGEAARFFYCAKASKRDRGEGNTHPTVKPTELMRYLCRLVTPPGGLVLDPFMGSGSTGKAARLEGFKFIGCELSAEYLEIARARIMAANDNAPSASEAAA